MFGAKKSADFRICFISQVYPGRERGYNPGIERLVEGLSRALADKGAEITVLTSFALGGPKEEVSPDGVRILRIKSLMGYKYSGIGGLGLATFHWSLVLKHLPTIRRSDIAQVFSAAFLPVPPLRSFLRPLVSYFAHLDRPNSFSELLYLPEVNLMLRVLYKCSDMIAAGVPERSPELEEFIQYFGINRERIRTVYEGVDIRLFNSRVDKQDVKSKFGENIVLYVGPLLPRKGLRYLLEAMPWVLREVADAKLVFVGKGPAGYVRWLLELAKQLQIEKHVFFEGFVPEERLAKYYRAAAVLALPTLREGYPLVCLEAMACGTPVVATNLSPISTMVGGGGILVGPKHPQQISVAIVRLLRDEVLRRTLGACGEARVRETFRWAKVADQYLNIYREALRLSGRGARRSPAPTDIMPPWG